MSGTPEPLAGTDVPDNTILLRRITPGWIVPDTVGGYKLSRQAFQDLPAEDGSLAMSVFVEERLVEIGLSHLSVLDGHPGYGLVAVAVAVARSRDLRVVWAPSPDDGERGRAHAHVLGTKTGSVRKTLVDGSEIRIWPPGV